VVTMQYRNSVIWLLLQYFFENIVMKLWSKSYRTRWLSTSHVKSDDDVSSILYVLPCRISTSLSFMLICRIWSPKKLEFLIGNPVWVHSSHQQGNDLNENVQHLLESYICINGDTDWCEMVTIQSTMDDIM
jgi:hypothetical protein